MKPENAFKHRIVVPALAQVPNCWFFLNESMLSIRGLPDVLGCCNGRLFAWELKHSLAEGSKQTGRIVLQRWVLEKIRSAGGIAKIVYPENIEECIDELRKL